MRDAGVDLRVRESLVALLVELCQTVQHAPARLGTDTRWVRQIKHWVTLAAELNALKFRRQKAGAPQTRVKRLVALFAIRNHHDERRQIFVRAAQAVAQPGAHARPARLLETRLNESDRGIVIDGFRIHGLDQADVVHDAGNVRHQFAHPGA